MKDKVLGSGNIFVDETPIDELAPGKGKTDQGYVVTVAGGQSLNPENRFYLYFSDRKHSHFNQLLAGYKGVLHSDKYGAYEQLAKKKSLIWAPCFSHIRRKFIEAEGTDPKLRVLALDMIQRLFKIEERAALLSEQERMQIRQTESVPLIDELIQFAQDHINKVLPKSKLGQAFGYLLGLKPYLKNYTKEPMARMDNNVAERALRPVAVGRKNWLFVGNEASGQNTAILLTFAQTCRALKINPHEYFEDIFRRFQSHPYNKLSDLLPENWKKLHLT
jgi:transposase